jgi:hypothetical protein
MQQNIKYYAPAIMLIVLLIAIVPSLGSGANTKTNWKKL